MDSNPVVAVVALLGTLGVFFVLMLVGRELVTWYWKVNEGLARLAMIEGVLRNIDKNITGLAQIAHTQQSAAQAPARGGQKWGVGS